MNQHNKTEPYTDKDCDVALKKCSPVSYKNIRTESQHNTLMISSFTISTENTRMAWHLDMYLKNNNHIVHHIAEDEIRKSNSTVELNSRFNGTAHYDMVEIIYFLWDFNITVQPAKLIIK